MKRTLAFLCLSFIFLMPYSCQKPAACDCTRLQEEIDDLKSRERVLKEVIVMMKEEASAKNPTPGFQAEAVAFEDSAIPRIQDKDSLSAVTGHKAVQGEREGAPETETFISLLDEGPRAVRDRADSILAVREENMIDVLHQDTIPVDNVIFLDETEPEEPIGSLVLEDETVNIFDMLDSSIYVKLNVQRDISQEFDEGTALDSSATAIPEEAVPAASRRLTVSSGILRKAMMVAMGILAVVLLAVALKLFLPAGKDKDSNPKKDAAAKVSVPGSVKERFKEALNKNKHEFVQEQESDISPSNDDNV